MVAVVLRMALLLRWQVARNVFVRRSCGRKNCVDARDRVQRAQSADYEQQAEAHVKIWMPLR
jgi:hypothetical protein